MTDSRWPKASLSMTGNVEQQGKLVGEHEYNFDNNEH